MNISEEGESLNKMYYLEYVKLCNKLGETPLEYSKFDLDTYHQLKVLNLKGNGNNIK